MSTTSERVHKQTCDGDSDKESKGAEQQTHYNTKLLPDDKIESDQCMPEILPLYSQHQCSISSEKLEAR